jgi:hypothetical protein
MANNSFTDLFTGNPVWAASVSYAAYTITGNFSLNWPTDFLDNPNTIGSFTSISVNANGYNVTLPTALAASVGQSIVFINTSPGNNNFVIKDNAGNTLITLNQGNAVCLLLTDNTTAAGTWLIFPFAQGTPAVTSVAATTPSAGLTIGGSPITSAGTLTFTLASGLSALANLGTTGIMVQSTTGPSTLVSRSLVGGTNIDVTNADGVLGNPVINLSDTLTALSSIQVGNLQFSSNLIQSTTANTNIQIIPNGTGSIFLGPGLTPPEVTSTGSMGNIVNLTAATLTGTTSVRGGNIELNANQVTNSVLNGVVAINGNGSGSVVLQSGATYPLTMPASGFLSHPSVALAKVSFTAASATILSGYNVASVTRTAAGNYTVTWTNALPSQYVISASCTSPSGTTPLIINYNSPTSSNVVINTQTTAAALTDPVTISVVAY